MCCFLLLKIFVKPLRWVEGSCCLTWDSSAEGLVTGDALGGGDVIAAAFGGGRAGTLVWTGLHAAGLGLDTASGSQVFSLNLLLGGGGAALTHVGRASAGLAFATTGSTAPEPSLDFLLLAACATRALNWPKCHSQVPRNALEAPALVSSVAPSVLQGHDVVQNTYD